MNQALDNWMREQILTLVREQSHGAGPDLHYHLTPILQIYWTFHEKKSFDLPGLIPLEDISFLAKEMACIAHFSALLTMTVFPANTVYAFPHQAFFIATKESELAYVIPLTDPEFEWLRGVVTPHRILKPLWIDIRQEPYWQKRSPFTTISWERMPAPEENEHKEVSH